VCKGLCSMCCCQGYKVHVFLTYLNVNHSISDCIDHVKKYVVELPFNLIMVICSGLYIFAVQIIGQHIMEPCASR
jgi:hypothetical protein